MQSMIKRAINYLLSLDISSANILDPELLQLLLVAVMSVDTSDPWSLGGADMTRLGHGPSRMVCACDPIRDSNET